MEEGILGYEGKHFSPSKGVLESANLALQTKSSSATTCVWQRPKDASLLV